MPDKWEYPWYAAWDLAFHTIALSSVDPDFAKEQTRSAARASLPAPDRPDTGLRVELQRREPAGPCLGRRSSSIAPNRHCAARPTSISSGRSSASCVLNFTWWVNRKDRFGRNLFEGGFLGLDNIGVFDRSAPLPTGGYLEQADGTAWMALFCQNMLEIAVELAAHDPTYETWPASSSTSFFWIAARHESGRARRHVGRRGRLLLRRAAPSRRHADAPQGALHGGSAAAVRRRR